MADDPSISFHFQAMAARVANLCRKRQMMSFWRAKSRQILRNVGSRFYVVFRKSKSFLCRFWFLVNFCPFYFKNHAFFTSKSEKFLPCGRNDKLWIFIQLFKHKYTFPWFCLSKYLYKYTVKNPKNGPFGQIMGGLYHLIMKSL